MKKLLILLLLASCAKDPIELTEIIVFEETIKTGISVRPVIGFDADRVTYKLRHGTNEPKSYGQSLNIQTHIEIDKGAYVIYQIKVFKGDEEVRFNAYTTRDGTQKGLTGTSFVRIKKGEVFKIYLY